MTKAVIVNLFQHALVFCAHSFQEIPKLIANDNYYYRREIQEFFTKGAEKNFVFFVGISSGCSLWINKCHLQRIF
jgi:hypothetical protein